MRKITPLLTQVKVRKITSIIIAGAVAFLLGLVVGTQLRSWRNQANTSSYVKSSRNDVVMVDDLNTATDATLTNEFYTEIVNHNPDFAQILEENNLTDVLSTKDGVYLVRLINPANDDINTSASIYVVNKTDHLALLESGHIVMEPESISRIFDNTDGNKAEPVNRLVVSLIGGAHVRDVYLISDENDKLELMKWKDKNNVVLKASQHCGMHNQVGSQSLHVGEYEVQFASMHVSNMDVMGQYLLTFDTDLLTGEVQGARCYNQTTGEDITFGYMAASPTPTGTQ